MKQRNKKILFFNLIVICLLLTSLNVNAEEEESNVTVTVQHPETAIQGDTFEIRFIFEYAYGYSLYGDYVHFTYFDSFAPWLFDTDRYTIENKPNPLSITISINTTEYGLEENNRFLFKLRYDVAIYNGMIYSSTEYTETHSVQIVEEPKSQTVWIIIGSVIALGLIGLLVYIIIKRKQ